MSIEEKLSQARKSQASIKRGSVPLAAENRSSLAERGRDSTNMRVDQGRLTTLEENQRFSEMQVLPLKRKKPKALLN